MAGNWTAADMRELGTRHAELETAGDLEGTMATLVDDPVYDFWPIGRRARGRDLVRRYYEHLMSDFLPRRLDVALIEEWLTERSLAQEYALEFEGDEGPERHHVLGILFVEGDGPLMAGERIWGSERCLRAMLGPVWDELETIEKA
jgi:hypothetical protein